MSTLDRIAGALSPTKPLREARRAALMLFGVHLVMVAPVLLAMIALFLTMER
jgi:hypothetical protein